MIRLGISLLFLIVIGFKPLYGSIEISDSSKYKFCAGGYLSFRNIQSSFEPSRILLTDINAEFGYFLTRSSYCGINLSLINNVSKSENREFDRLWILGGTYRYYYKFIFPEITLGLGGRGSENSLGEKSSVMAYSLKCGIGANLPIVESVKFHLVLSYSHTTIMFTKDGSRPSNQIMNNLIFQFGFFYYLK